MDTMNPPDDEHNIARNMQRKLTNIINKWCIKLEHEIKHLGQSTAALYNRTECERYWEARANIMEN